MVKCGDCGLENTDGLDYCDGCGAKLDAGASAAAAPSAPAAEVKPAEAAPDAAKAPTGEIKAEAPAPVAPSAAAPAPAPAAAAIPTFKAKLVVVRGEHKGKEFPLEDGNNQLGRWDPDTGSFPEVDFEQDDPEAKISRKHALIRIINGAITIEDSGSLNGTFLNRGQRLAAGNPQELKDGDEIIVGKTFLKMTVEPVS
jgi:hypothetical protein